MNQPPQPDRSRSVSSPVPAWFLTVVTLPILLGLLWFGRDFLMPIALAVLLLILNMAIIDRLDSLTIAGKSVPRWLAYLTATAFVFLVVISLGYSVSQQAAAIQEAAPRYAARLIVLRTEVEGFLGTELVASVERAIKDLDVDAWLTGFVASAVG